MGVTLTDLMDFVASFLVFPKSDVTGIFYIGAGGYNYVFGAYYSNSFFEKKRIVFKIQKNSFFPFLLSANQLDIIKNKMCSLQKKYEIKFFEAKQKDVFDQLECYKQLINEIISLRNILENPIVCQQTGNNLIVLPYSFSFYRIHHFTGLEFLLNSEPSVIVENDCPYDQTPDFPKRSVRIFNDLNQEAINAGAINKAKIEVFKICNHHFEAWSSPFLERKTLHIERLEKVVQMINHNNRWLTDAHKDNFRSTEHEGKVYVIVIDPAFALTTNLIPAAPKSPISKELTQPFFLDIYKNHWRENQTLEPITYPFLLSRVSKAHNDEEKMKVKTNNDPSPFKLSSNGSELLLGQPGRSLLFKPFG